jgi:hypothetical protein
VFWLYLLVVAIEVFLMFHHDNLSNWEWVAGRAAFFLVFLAVVASCENVEAAGKALRGLTYGASVIGLLTMVHALGIVHLPFATPLWAPRKFGPLQMPFPRTMGLAMTPDKFGMIAGVALATVIASSVGRERLIRSAWGRSALFFVVSSGSLIAQQRGVYLEVCLAIALSGYFLWMRTKPCPWFAGARGSWFAAAAYALLLILSNLVFSAAPPEFILDAGSPVSVDNVLQRIDINAAGWLLFKQAPLLGIGHGRFRELSLLPKGIHNHFWEHLVSTGLAGGIPYLLFHMLILVLALRLCAHPQSMTRAVASILSVSVMVAYLAYQFAPMFFVSVFALISGLVVSASHNPGQARQTRTAQDAPNAGEDGA